eukprot:TRINITY_DN87660_c0_g1_i1.p1 TRINITY_DN87660_c0_g1~~TRINITY_DN87660_c0_g1_i1.p1  ORF type:complete len:121 (+),score=9.44 TRINITY_DN87660_c0_g1_i1:84-446(+)
MRSVASLCKRKFGRRYVVNVSGVPPIFRVQLLEHVTCETRNSDVSEASFASQDGSLRFTSNSRKKFGIPIPSNGRRMPSLMLDPYCLHSLPPLRLIRISIAHSDTYPKPLTTRCHRQNHR